MAKYADDTYLMIPACNVDSREREISNIEAWSRVNNLTLNQSKSAEIVFTDSRKRRLVQPPPPLQGIARVTSLGVTVTEKLYQTLRRGAAFRHLPTVSASRILRRAARSGLWDSATSAEDLVDAADESLFKKVLRSKHHVLDELLPATSEAHHNLRKRRHD